MDIDARAYMKTCIFTYDETIKYMVDMTLNMIDILFDLMMCFLEIAKSIFLEENLR